MLKRLVTEERLQLLILMVVAGMAGAASFTHVHDWTMHNTPAGTGSWFGWANAVITELVPAGAGIEIRRRKRLGHGYSVKYPMAILIADAGVSLGAQLSDAVKTFAGGLAFALPALAFLALTKLILSRPHARKEEPAWNHSEPGTPATTSTGTTTPDGSASPSATTAPAATPPSPAPAPGPIPETPAPNSMKTGSPASAASSDPAPAPAGSTSTQEPDPAPAEPAPAPPGQLLMPGRMAAFSHHQATGHPITPGELADRMNITPGEAETILLHLGDTPSTVTTANGTALSGSRP